MADNRLEMEIAMKAKEATEQMSQLIDKFDELIGVTQKTHESMNSSFEKMSSDMSKLSNSIMGTTSKAEKSFDKMGKGYRNTGKDMERTSGGIVKSLARLSAKIYTITRVFSGLGKAIKSAMDYRETVHLFSTVFSRLGDEAGVEFQKGFENRLNQFQDKMATLGLDPNMLMNYQAVFAQMSKSMGVVSETAYDISESFVALGADLSALYNVPIESMMGKLQSGLAGQIRPLRDLGIDISKTTLMEEARMRGINKSIEVMTANEKVQLRYLAIMRQTQIAMGDMASTIDRPTNQLRVMSAQWIIAARAIGDIFLPVVQKVIPFLTALAMIITKVARAIGSLFGMKSTKPKITPGKGSGMSFASPEPIPDAGGGGKKSKGTDWDKQAKGVDKVRKKVKQLKSDLMGFDEINILQKPPEALDPSKNAGKSKTPKIGGTGGAGGIGPEFDLSDEIAAMNAEYQKMLDEIIGRTESEAERIANRIMQLAQETRLTPMLKEIAGLVMDIGKSWKEAWKSDGPEILSLVKSILTNIFGTIENIAVSFRKAWNENDRGVNIMHNINSVIISILRIAEGLTGTFKKVWGDYGDTLARAFVTTLEKATETLSVLGEVLVWIWDNGGEYVFEQFLRLGALIGELAMYIFNEFVAPFIQWFSIEIAPVIAIVVSKIGDVLKVFADLIEYLLGDGKPVLDLIIGVVGSLGSAFLILKGATVAYDKTVGKLTKVVEKAKTGMDLFSKALTFLTTPTGLVVVAIAAVIAIGVTLYKNWDKISAKAKELGNKIKNAWNNMLTNTKDRWNKMKDSISSNMEKARSNARNKANSIKSSLSSSWNSALSNTKTKFNNIANSVRDGMNRAKNAIANSRIGQAWNRIWNLKLPKIKLPHFNVRGDFSLIPPRAPSFSVDWYDKGGIFTGPQVIGVGEKRPEFVGALDDLREIVRDESGGANGDITINVILDGDVIRERTVSNINRQNRIAGQNVINV